MLTTKPEVLPWSFRMPASTLHLSPVAQQYCHPQPSLAALCLCAFALGACSACGTPFLQAATWFNPLCPFSLCSSSHPLCKCLFNRVAASNHSVQHRFFFFFHHCLYYAWFSFIDWSLHDITFRIHFSSVTPPEGSYSPGAVKSDSRIKLHWFKSWFIYNFP